MNKKGSIFDLITGLGFFLAAVILMVAMYMIVQEMAAIPAFNTAASNAIMQSAVSASKTFDFVAVMFFFGFIIGSTILVFFLRTSPLFLPFNLFVYIVGLILAVGISNSYETFLTLSQGTLTTALDAFTLSNFLLQNLPIVYGVFGLILFLFLFFIKPRDDVESTGL